MRILLAFLLSCFLPSAYVFAISCTEMASTKTHLDRLDEVSRLEKLPDISYAMGLGVSGLAKVEVGQIFKPSEIDLIVRILESRQAMSSLNAMDSSPSSMNIMEWTTPNRMKSVVEAIGSNLANKLIRFTNEVDALVRRSLPEKQLVLGEAAIATGIPVQGMHTHPSFSIAMTKVERGDPTRFELFHHQLNSLKPTSDAVFLTDQRHGSPASGVGRLSLVFMWVPIENISGPGYKYSKDSIWQGERAKVLAEEELYDGL